MNISLCTHHRCMGESMWHQNLILRPIRIQDRVFSQYFPHIFIDFISSMLKLLNMLIRDHVFDSVRAISLFWSNFGKNLRVDLKIGISWCFTTVKLGESVLTGWIGTPREILSLCLTRLPAPVTRFNPSVPIHPGWRYSFLLSHYSNLCRKAHW